MKLTIKPVNNRSLAGVVQFYIFCAAGESGTVTYQTFPNTNLCLSLYRNNTVTHNKEMNFCTVTKGRDFYSSKLWGFHERVFNVSIHSEMDQVCILFNPGGLRNFTNLPYEQLMHHPDVFREIFGREANKFLEQLFDMNELTKRVLLLENFFCKRMRRTHQNNNMNWVVQEVLSHHGNITIASISDKLGINNATLYKQFINAIGQGPKDFIKTVRFRSALSLLKVQQELSLTDICYSADYYDQSHFIKEFRQFTDKTPKEIRNTAVIEQEKLIWVNNTG